MNAPPCIVLVTDPAFGDEVILRCVRDAGRALPRGALCVQLRDKVRPLTSLRVFASSLRLATRQVGAWLVVNGQPGVARDVGAEGVHLGGGGGPVAAARALVGRATWVTAAAHSDEDVRLAFADGADAVLVSPVFRTRPPSSSAPEKAPRGLSALRSARAEAGKGAVIYALGGVDIENASACIRAGADGVAVMRALLAATDAARAARAIHDALARRW